MLLHQIWRYSIFEPTSWWTVKGWQQWTYKWMTTRFCNLVSTIPQWTNCLPTPHAKVVTVEGMTTISQEVGRALWKQLSKSSVIQLYPANINFRNHIPPRTHSYDDQTISIWPEYIKDHLRGMVHLIIAGHAVVAPRSSLPDAPNCTCSDKWPNKHRVNWVPEFFQWEYDGYYPWGYLYTYIYIYTNWF